MQSLKRGFAAVVIFSFAINLLMLASPLYMLQIYDRVLTSQSIDTLVMLTLIITVALMMIGLLEAVRSGLMVRMSTWLDEQLSGTVLRASVIASVRPGAEANAQGLRDIGTLRGFLTGPGIFPVMDAPWAPVYIGVIYLLHPVLGWIALGGAVLLFSIAVLNEQVTRKLLHQSGAANIRALNQVNTAVRNADVIEAMGFLPNIVARWHRLNRVHLTLQAKASQWSGMLTAVSKFLRMSLQVAMLGGGAYLTISGETTPGGMIAAAILLGRALAPVEQAINSWKLSVTAREAYHRVKELLDNTPVRGHRMSMPAPVGNITAENLTYAFPGARHALIKNLNFEISSGDMIGLIGPSGSGKTTLSRLLLGNLVPVSGHARLDGMDVSQWEPEDRASYIGYLPQDIELFSGSIRDNISRMGEGESEVIVAAAKLAGVHEMIAHMPQGYDTVIGEGGHTLSGGERQRVALARALYGDPRFVILDEPNSSLDLEGEQSLLAALAYLKERNITTIIIAHRPAVLANADKIMVLKDGAVQAYGPRDKVFALVSGKSVTGLARAEAVAADINKPASSKPGSTG